MLDSADVAVLLGVSAKNRNRAHLLAKDGKILGVKRGRGTDFCASIRIDVVVP